MGFATDHLYPMEFGVYVAGIQVPASQISITCALNQFPVATIALPPEPGLYGIGRMDRVPVHIYMVNTLVNTFFMATPELIFEGELSNFGMSNNVLGNSFNISATALPSFLNDVHIKLLLNNNDFLHVSTKGANAAEVGIATPKITYPASLFTHGIVPVKNAEVMKSPSDFLKNLSTFLKNEAGGIKNSPILEFYTKYSKALKFEDRFATLPYFDDPGYTWSKDGENKGGFPILAALKKGQAANLLFNGSQQVSGPKASIFSMLNKINHMMAYDFVSLGAPTWAGGKMVTCGMKPLLYEAMAPKCNVLFRSHMVGYNTNEKVIGGLTRLRMADINSTFANLSANNNTLAKFATLDYYPHEKDYEGNKSRLSSELLGATDKHSEFSEQFCGPNVYDCTSPSWMTYLDSAITEGDNSGLFKNSILRHQFMLKLYEQRRMNVESAFNPYVTPGFPGIFFDKNIEDFGFMGHVLTVSHMISKQQLTTNTTFGYARTLKEQLDAPLSGILPEVDEVTEDVDKMSEVYQALLGCDATDFIELEELEEQENPKKAYKFNKRRLVSADEYVSFMGGDKLEYYKETRLPVEFTSEYFTERKRKLEKQGKFTEFRQVLKDINSTIRKQDRQIYL